MYRIQQLNYFTIYLLHYCRSPYSCLFVDHPAWQDVSLGCPNRNTVQESGYCKRFRQILSCSFSPRHATCSRRGRHHYPPVSAPFTAFKIALMNRFSKSEEAKLQQLLMVKKSEIARHHYNCATWKQVKGSEIDEAKGHPCYVCTTNKCNVRRFRC